MKVRRFEAFVKGVKATGLSEIWRGEWDELEFEIWLNQIDVLLELAIREQAWVYLCLNKVSRKNVSTRY